MVSWKILLITALVIASSVFVDSTHRRHYGKLRNVKFGQNHLGHLRNLFKGLATFDLNAPPSNFDDTITLSVNLSIGCGKYIDSLVPGLGDLFIRIYLALAKITVCILGPANVQLCQRDYYGGVGKVGGLSINTLIGNYGLKWRGCRKQALSIIAKQSGGKGIDYYRGSTKSFIDITMNLAELLDIEWSSSRKQDKNYLTRSLVHLNLALGILGKKRDSNVGEDVAGGFFGLCRIQLSKNGYQTLTDDDEDQIRVGIDVAIGSGSSGNDDDREIAKSQKQQDRDDRRDARDDRREQRAEERADRKRDRAVRRALRKGLRASGFSKAIRLLFRRIRRLRRLSRVSKSELRLIEKLLNFGVPKSFDDVIDVGIHLTRGFGLVLDFSFIPGLGDLLSRIFIAISKITICLLGRVQCRVCSDSYFNLGAPGNINTVLTTYKLQGCRSKILGLINRHNNNRGLDIYTGSQKIILDSILNLGSLLEAIEQGKGNKNDYTRSLSSLNIVFGSLAATVDLDVGQDLVGGYTETANQYLPEQGLDNINEEQEDKIAVNINIVININQDNKNEKQWLVDDDENSNTSEGSDDSSDSSTNKQSSGNTDKDSDDNDSNKTTSSSGGKNNKSDSNKKDSNDNENDNDDKTKNQREQEENNKKRIEQEDKDKKQREQDAKNKKQREQDEKNKKQREQDEKNKKQREQEEQDEKNKKQREQEEQDEKNKKQREQDEKNKKQREQDEKNKKQREQDEKNKKQREQDEKNKKQREQEERDENDKKQREEDNKNEKKQDVSDRKQQRADEREDRKRDRATRRALRKGLRASGLSKAIKLLFRRIRKLRRVSRVNKNEIRLIETLLNLGAPKSFDDVIDVGIQLTRGFGLVLDVSFIPGLGDLLSRIFVAISKITICLLGRVQCRVCSDSYFNLGAPGNINTVLTTYKLQGCRSKILGLINRYNNNKGLDIYTGSQKIILDAVLNLGDIVEAIEQGKGNKRDYSRALGSSSIIFGALGTTVDVDAGQDLIGGFTETVNQYLPEQGLDNINEEQEDKIAVNINVVININQDNQNEKQWLVDDNENNSGKDSSDGSGNSKDSSTTTNDSSDDTTSGSTNKGSNESSNSGSSKTNNSSNDNTNDSNNDTTSSSTNKGSDGSSNSGSSKTNNSSNDNTNDSNNDTTSSSTNKGSDGSSNSGSSKTNNSSNDSTSDSNDDTTSSSTNKDSDGSSKSGGNKSSSSSTSDKSEGSDNSNSSSSDSGSSTGSQSGKGNAKGVKRGGGVRTGVSLSSVVSRLFKQLKNTSKVSGQVVDSLINFEQPTDFGSSVTACVDISRGLGGLLDVSFINGLGSLLAKIFTAIVKITICLLGSGKSSVCTAQLYNVGEVSGNSADVIKQFGLEDANQQVQNLIKKSGKGLDSYEGNQKTILELSLSLSQILKSNISKEDFVNALLHVISIQGIVVSTYVEDASETKLGDGIIGGLIELILPYLDQLGYTSTYDVNDQQGKISYTISPIDSEYSSPWTIEVTTVTTTVTE